MSRTSALTLTYLCYCSVLREVPLLIIVGPQSKAILEGMTGMYDHVCMFPANRESDAFLYTDSRTPRVVLELRNGGHNCHMQISQAAGCG